jgi:hypothetical protein
MIGCDPGPSYSALVGLECASKQNLAPDQGFMMPVLRVLGAGYVRNDMLAPTLFGASPEDPVFLAYEACGAQGKFVGETTFETAAMGGEIRQMYRKIAGPAYGMKSSDWRYMLSGQGNAGTPLVYASICRYFTPVAIPATEKKAPKNLYKGSTKYPGPLWDLHLAGEGGTVEHLKDALGVVIGLLLATYRTGRDPEEFRRPY